MKGVPHYAAEDGRTADGAAHWAVGASPLPRGEGLSGLMLEVLGPLGPRVISKLTAGPSFSSRYPWVKIAD